MFVVVYTYAGAPLTPNVYLKAKPNTIIIV